MGNGLINGVGRWINVVEHFYNIRTKKGFMKPLLIKAIKFSHVGRLIIQSLIRSAAKKYFWGRTSNVLRGSCTAHVKTIHVVKKSTLSVSFMYTRLIFCFFNIDCYAKFTWCVRWHIHFLLSLHFKKRIRCNFIQKTKLKVPLRTFLNNSKKWPKIFEKKNSKKWPKFFEKKNSQKWPKIFEKKEQ